MAGGASKDDASLEGALHGGAHGEDSDAGGVTREEFVAFADKLARALRPLLSVMRQLARMTEELHGGHDDPGLRTYHFEAIRDQFDAVVGRATAVGPAAPRMAFGVRSGISHRARTASIASGGGRSQRGFSDADAAEFEDIEGAGLEAGAMSAWSPRPEEATMGFEDLCSMYGVEVDSLASAADPNSSSKNNRDVRSTLWRLFCILDVDGDGRVTRAEFLARMGRLLNSSPRGCAAVVLESFGLYEDAVSSMAAESAGVLSPSAAAAAAAAVDKKERAALLAVFRFYGAMSSAEATDEAISLLQATARACGCSTAKVLLEVLPWHTAVRKVAELLRGDEFNHAIEADSREWKADLKRHEAEADAARMSFFWWLTFMNLARYIGYPWPAVLAERLKVLLSTDAQGIAGLSSVIAFTAVPGCLLTPWLNQRFGSARVIWGLAILSAIGAVMEVVGVAAESYWVVFFARFLYGTGAPLTTLSPMMLLSTMPLGRYGTLYSTLTSISGLGIAIATAFTPLFDMDQHAVVRILTGAFLMLCAYMIARSLKLITKLRAGHATLATVVSVTARQAAVAAMAAELDAPLTVPRTPAPAASQRAEDYAPSSDAGTGTGAGTGAGAGDAEGKAEFDDASGAAVAISPSTSSAKQESGGMLATLRSMGEPAVMVALLLCGKWICDWAWDSIGPQMLIARDRMAESEAGVVVAAASALQLFVGPPAGWAQVRTGHRLVWLCVSCVAVAASHTLLALTHVSGTLLLIGRALFSGCLTPIVYGVVPLIADAHQRPSVLAVSQFAASIAMNMAIQGFGSVVSATDPAAVEGLAAGAFATSELLAAALVVIILLVPGLRLWTLAARRGVDMDPKAAPATSAMNKAGTGAAKKPFSDSPAPSPTSSVDGSTSSGTAGDSGRDGEGSTVGGAKPAPRRSTRAATDRSAWARRRSMHWRRRRGRGSELVTPGAVAPVSALQ